MLCRFTAWLAVDTRVVTGKVNRTGSSQPVEQPRGWDMAMQAEPMAIPATLTGARYAAAPTMAPMMASAPMAARSRGIHLPIGKAGKASRAPARGGSGNAPAAQPVQRENAPSVLDEAREAAIEEVRRLRAAGQAAPRPSGVSCWPTLAAGCPR